MFVAKVTGSVVSTQKVETMRGQKLLIVEPYRLEPKERQELITTGRTFVAVDTLGAGDAFISAFLLAHLEGQDLPGCLKAGAEFGIFPYCRKSSVRYFRQFLATLKREICRRSACASADSSAYLMKLC